MGTSSYAFGHKRVLAKGGCPLSRLKVDLLNNAVEIALELRPDCVVSFKIIPPSSIGSSKQAAPDLSGAACLERMDAQVARRRLATKPMAPRPASINA